MTITKEKLEKFIAIRNNSPFASNMQFAFDADEAGFSFMDLGAAFERDGGGYEWHVTEGTLIEEPNGEMRLEAPK